MTIPQVVDGVTDADAAFMNQLVDAANQANAAFNGAGQITTAAITPALEGYGPLNHMRSGVANILDYNANAGDGSTSINSIISEMMADTTTGDVLEFPAGAYLLTAQWTVSSPRTIIFRPGATVTLANGVNDNMMRIQVPGVVVQGGVFEANGDNQTGDRNGIIIGHKDAVGCVIDGVTVNNAKYMGIRSYAARTRIINCEVNESKYMGIMVQAPSPISSGDQADSEILFCRVDRSGQPNNVAIGCGIAAYGETASGYHTIGTKIIGNTVRMPMNPTSDLCIPIETHDLGPSTIISGNNTYGGSIAISCNQSDGSTVQGNVVTDAKYYGVECADTSRMSIVGNTMNGLAGSIQGISASSVITPHSHLTAVGNIITGFEYGIHVQDHSHTVIGGNVVELTASGVAIGIKETEKTTIVGNDLFGVGSGTGVRFDTGSRALVQGNTIDNFVHAVGLLATSAYTFEESIVGRNMIRNCTNAFSESLSGGATRDASFVVLDVPPTVSGSRGGNAALASLLTELAAKGIIVDGTS